MTTETRPLRLLPHQRRLLPDGRWLIEPQVGESFEVPDAYLPLFEAIERGASLSQLIDLVQNKFSRLRRFLLFLNDRDLLADNGYRKLADSLTQEYNWPTSLATSSLTEIQIAQSEPSPKSQSVVAEIASAALAIALGVWSLTVFPAALSIQNFETPTGQKLFVLFLVGFSGARSVVAILSWLVPYFAVYKPSLAFVLEPLSIRLRTHQGGASLPGLTLLGLFAATLSVYLFAKIASVGRYQTEASWLSFFSLAALIVELSPFSQSSLTEWLKSAYAKNENEAAVRKLHVSLSVVWVALLGLTTVIAAPSAGSRIYQHFRDPSTGALDRIASLFILVACASLFLSWFIDIISTFSYDEKTASSLRRMWMKKQPNQMVRLQTASPTAKEFEKLPFLRQIDPAVRQKLIDLSELAEVKEGAALCRQGDTDRSLFVVLSGRFAVAKKQAGASGSQRRKVVALLDSGAVFGEAAFFFATPRTADIVAMEDSRVLRIPHIAEMKTIEVSKSDELTARIWFLQSLMASSTFKELPSESLDAILVAGERKVFAPGSRVIQEGEAGDACYFLIQGQASVSQNTALINKMKSGDAFGEIAVLNPGTLRTATITAESELIAIRIDANRFWQLLRSHLPLALEIERLASERIRRDLLRREKNSRRA